MDYLLELDPDLGMAPRPAELAANLIELLVEGGHLPAPITVPDDRWTVCGDTLLEWRHGQTWVTLDCAAIGGDDVEMPPEAFASLVAAVRRMERSAPTEQLAAAAPGPQPGQYDPRLAPTIHLGRLFLYRGPRTASGEVGEIQRVLMVVAIDRDGDVQLASYGPDGTQDMIDDPRTAPGTRQVHEILYVPIDRIQALLEAGAWDLDYGQLYEIDQVDNAIVIRRRDS